MLGYLLLLSHKTMSSNSFKLTWFNTIYNFKNFHDVKNVDF